MPPELDTPPDAPQPDYIIDQLEGDKSLAIEVPTGDTHTYLRMGDSPPNETALHSVKVGDVFEGAPHLDKMSAGFIHGAEKVGNLDQFVQVGGWYDHTDGNRVSTTAKSKVEIIKGDYKLITCDGKAGIDFSGGHLRMWSDTPGCITKVWEGKEVGATETVKATKRYSFRFIGGRYDESYNGRSYHAYYGTRSIFSPDVGLPRGSNPAHEKRLEEYHTEVHAKDVKDIFHATRLEASRTVSTELRSDDRALEIRSKRTGTLSIKDEDEVFLAKAEREVSPWAVKDKVSVAGTSVEQTVTPLGTTAVYLGPGYSQEFNGATYSDRVMASSRSGFSSGSLWRDVRAYDNQQQMDLSKTRVDLFLGAYWVDLMVAGNHFELRGTKFSASLMDITMGKVNVENSLLKTFL